MTLHFPTLPGMRMHACDGWSHQEGVSKLRLYPDPAGDGAYAVPISFPGLRLPKDSLSAEEARTLVRCWTESTDSIGELLVDAAHVYDAETVFRMLSTCAEVDIVCGLARALAGAFPDEPITLTVDRDSLHSLFGPHAGPRVAERIDAQVRAARSAARRGPPSVSTASPTAPPSSGGGRSSTTTRSTSSRRRSGCTAPGHAPPLCAGWSRSPA